MTGRTNSLVHKSLQQFHQIKYKEFIKKDNPFKDIDKIKTLLKNEGIECKKYNYNLDKECSTSYCFLSTIKLS